MTPQEFAEAMREIAQKYRNDPERGHQHADDLMLRCLRENGFTEGADLFPGGWYA